MTVSIDADDKPHGRVFEALLVIDPTILKTNR